MQFTPMDLPGVYQIALDKHEDERGFFARTWCEKEFKAIGLRDRMVQDSIAFNAKKGTLRGMHYQASPSKQAKLVRCISGHVFMAVADLRKDSPSFLKHLVDEVSADNFKAYYIPPGLALGYLTLVDNSIVHYQMPEFYDPTLERGFRWNDKSFSIPWPKEVLIMNDRDRHYADFDLKALQ